MPRRSAADLATIRVQAERPRLNPPEFLDDREQALFRETVQSCSADHFAASDTPLLVSYVQATLMARGAIKDAPADKAALGVWERATKMQAVLATKLRLTVQSRIDPKVVGRNTPKAYLRRPWEA